MKTIMRSVWIGVSILFLSKSSSRSINPKVNLQWTNESCIGPEGSLSSTYVWVNFTVSGEMSSDQTSSEEMSSGQTGVCFSTCRQTIKYNSSLQIDLDSCLAKYSEISNITFEFKQPENGGDLCHCVGINFTDPDKIFK